jgi:hypothetical protein
MLGLTICRLSLRSLAGASAARQTREGPHIVRQDVENLLFFRPHGDLRSLEAARVIQCAHERAARWCRRLRKLRSASGDRANRLGTPLIWRKASASILQEQVAGSARDLHFLHRTKGRCAWRYVAKQACLGPVSSPANLGFTVLMTRSSQLGGPLSPSWARCGWGVPWTRKR